MPSDLIVTIEGLSLGAAGAAEPPSVSWKRASDRASLRRRFAVQAEADFKRSLQEIERLDLNLRLGPDADNLRSKNRQRAFLEKRAGLSWSALRQAERLGAALAMADLADRRAISWRRLASAQAVRDSKAQAMAAGEIRRLEGLESAISDLHQRRLRAVQMSPTGYPAAEVKRRAVAIVQAVRGAAR